MRQIATTTFYVRPEQHWFLSFSWRWIKKKFIALTYLAFSIWMSRHFVFSRAAKEIDFYFGRTISWRTTDRSFSVVRQTRVSKFGALSARGVSNCYSWGRGVRHFIGYEGSERKKLYFESGQSAKNFPHLLWLTWHTLMWQPPQRPNCICQVILVVKYQYVVY